MFMQIAIAAIGIGIVVMVGYLVIANVVTSLSAGAQNTETNPCYGEELNHSNCANGTIPPCYANPADNTTATYTCVDRTVNTSIASTRVVVFAGFSLIVVGVIVLAAFGLISVFK